MTSTDAAPLILVVDDEPFNVDYLVQELDDLGFETTTAVNGQEALDAVVERRPDLILLDIMMPMLDGFEVCRRLKSDPATQLIPIVMMTALTSTEDRIKGIEAGADDFLSKPVDERELMARIKTALRTKRVVDATQEELSSAREQLERAPATSELAGLLGIHLHGGPSDESVSPVEAAGDVLETVGGVRVDSEGLPLWAFRDEHALDRVIDASQAVLAEVEASLAGGTVGGVGIAIGYGEMAFRPQRSDRNGRPRWLLGVEGAAAGEVGALLPHAPAGGVLVGESFESSPDGSYRLEPAGIDAAPAGARFLMCQFDESAGPGARAGIQWPSEYADLHEALRGAWGLEEVYLSRVLSGKSGALVFAADARTDGFDGQAILKLDTVVDWDEDDEPTRHRAAAERTPDYARDHMPQIVHEHKDDAHLALLQTIAGRGLQYSSPWAHAPFSTQVAIGERLSLDLLGAWNERYRWSDGYRAPHHNLEDWLDYRLRPEDGGRVHQLLTEVLDLDPEIDTVTIEGSWYPNPLALARASMLIPESARQRTLLGNTHGDLHGFNVLVTGTGVDVDYVLIDLAFYRSEAPLLFDHAYLEISHLVNSRAATSGRRFMSIVEALDGGEVLTGDDLGLVNVLARIRAGIAAWQEEREPHRPADVEGQMVLGRVAAGLNFAHKRIDDLKRTKAFAYASAAARQYIEFHAVDWPRSGPAIDLDAVVGSS